MHRRLFAILPDCATFDYGAMVVRFQLNGYLAGGMRPLLIKETCGRREVLGYCRVTCILNTDHIEDGMCAADRAAYRWRLDGALFPWRWKVVFRNDRYFPKWTALETTKLRGWEVGWS